MTDISVIIPLATNETAWKDLLLEDLTKLPDGTEILFVIPENARISHETILLPQKKIQFLEGKPGRGSQMNKGAKVAKGKFLWFLHADSRFGHNTLPALLRAIQNYPNNLLYFDLAFLDASHVMSINSWGVRFRSRILKIPFGDQGFCIKKELFYYLTGFPENLPYGEDHIFVWKAKQNNIEIQAICATLYTSARKYKKYGWLKTTCMHQYLWVKQAWPEWKKFRKKSNGINGAIAVFAKTKNLSKVKTRLAADIGVSLAEAFYTLSVEAVAELIKSSQKQSQHDFVPYWALAEKEALNYKEWKDFNTIWTGEGGLGERLHTIYSSLHKKHDYVVIIGTDSPQLEPEIIISAIKKLNEQPESCVIGPAFDGGFYLVAAKTAIIEQIWTKVNYSQSTTLEELSSNFAAHKINIQLLPLKGDVDTVNDLKMLMNALAINSRLLPKQHKLQKWLQSQLEIIPSNKDQYKN